MSARTDLRGGWRATAIPTATPHWGTTTKNENEENYRELGADYFDRIDVSRVRRSPVRRLERPCLKRPNK
jgi:hypothetical protein